jgi:hypothetical protein
MKPAGPKEEMHRHRHLADSCRCGCYALLQGGSVVKRIDITASWVVRLLAQDEPMTKLVDGVSSTTRTDEARHLITVTGR